MTTKRILARLVFVTVATLCAWPTSAETGKSAPSGATATTTARVHLTEDEKVQMMRNIVDVNVPMPCTEPPPCPVPPIPSPNQFPVELRLLTLLTLDINFSDLFGAGGGKGKSIQDTIKAMAANWEIYERRLADGPDGQYFKSLYFYNATHELLPMILEEVTKPAYRDYHKNRNWRALYVSDIRSESGGYGTPPGPINARLFQLLRDLSKRAVGGVRAGSNDEAYPLFPFLELPSKTIIDPEDRSRRRVNRITGNTWLNTVGHLTYYDLFTLSYESPGVTPEINCAIQRAMGYKGGEAGCSATSNDADEILRVAGELTDVEGLSQQSIAASGGGNDCCCQTLDPVTGKKRCFDTPDYGCTNTGNPLRCALGSIACPAGTVCP